MRKVVLLVFTSFSLTVFASSAAAAPEARAHGHGATAFQQFSFAARGTPTNASGHVTAHIPIVEGEPRLLVSGQVTCLNVVPATGEFGDRAVLTGPVTTVQHNQDEPLFEFDRFYVVVEDNGKGNPATPDRWNGTFYRSGTLGEIEEQLGDCNAVLPFGNPLVEGDIEVVPAS
jgi:hypothetical protein